MSVTAVRLTTAALWLVMAVHALHGGHHLFALVAAATGGVTAMSWRQTRDLVRTVQLQRQALALVQDAVSGHPAGPPRPPAAPRAARQHRPIL